MALYVPAARRRQRAIAVGVAGIVLGMFIGWLVGRGSAPSLEERVAVVQADAAAVVQRLQELPARAAATPGGDGDVTVTTSAAATTAATTTAATTTDTTTTDTTTTDTTTTAVDVRAEIDAIRRDVDDVVDRAPWISERTAALLDQQLAAVAAASTRDPALFATATRAAVAALNLAFGLNS